MNTIRIVHRGAVVAVDHVAPDRTLLSLLREDLGCTSVKEGCGEGDCGACTVVVAEQRHGALHYQAINSCIRLAHAVDGMALWTAQDLAQDPLLQHSSGGLAPAPNTHASDHADAPAQACTAAPAPAGTNANNAASSTTPLLGNAPTLHPVQQAMVDCHASQCGFCTPGFVMSLFALYQQRGATLEPLSRAQAQQALSGNLCRCTGYRPILDAAQSMAQYPQVQVDESKLLYLLKQTIHNQKGFDGNFPTKNGYLQPSTLAQLLQLRASQPQAQLVAGCTDVGLWVTKQHKQFAQVLDVSRVAELRRVEQYPHHCAIGAAVSLTDAFSALIQDRPQLAAWCQRFAGLPVRNAGTLGGNIANGSPIGDSMPLLIALGANVVLSRWQAGTVQHRELPLEDLYTGYRTNVMRHDEVLTWIKVPKPQASELMRIYKVSKRYEDDISAVCLAVALRIQNGSIVHASIGAGGVAATPVRASATQAALAGQPWSQATVTKAAAVLQAEFQPISDMRASAQYRSTVLGNMLQRLWFDGQDATLAQLDNRSATELA